MYGEPKQELLVPVGEDQAPHVELTREVVRRFDTHFGFVVKDALFDAANQTALEQAVDSAKVTLPRVEDTPAREGTESQLYPLHLENARSKSA